MGNDLTIIPQPTNVGKYYLIEQSTTDDRLIDLWASKSRRSDTGNTESNYLRIAQEFLAEVGKPIQAITYGDLAGWVQGLEGSINTRRTKIGAVRSMFSFAHRIGYVRMNPALMIEPPAKEETKHRKLLSEEEIVRLIAIAPTIRDEAILRVLYSSGMRVSELCNLRWHDAIWLDGKAILVVRGKGGKTRESGISGASTKALLKLKPAGADDQGEYIFSGRNGKPIDRTTINWLFSKLSKRIGKKISPHWMRHSHVSHALARGANPVDVQEQVGHSSLQVTTGYAHKTRSSSDYLIV